MPNKWVYRSEQPRSVRAGIVSVGEVRIGSVCREKSKACRYYFQTSGESSSIMSCNLASPRCGMALSSQDLRILPSRVPAVEICASISAIIFNLLRFCRDDSQPCVSAESTNVLTEA